MVKSNQKPLRDYLITTICAIALAYLIRIYVVEAYRIPSQTMSPTLIPGDVIFVAKWPLVFQKEFIPKRGDVVVYADRPKGSLDNFEYVKRVVGLPGDQISIKNGVLYFNGNPLSKSTQTTGVVKEQLPGEKSYSITYATPPLEDVENNKIPNDSVFVIADYRIKNGKKKKTWDIVPIASLKGKALSIWLSIEPYQTKQTKSWIPQFRFERMFTTID